SDSAVQRAGRRTDEIHRPPEGARSPRITVPRPEGRGPLPGREGPLLVEPVGAVRAVVTGRAGLAHVEIVVDPVARGRAATRTHVAARSGSRHPLARWALETLVQGAVAVVVAPSAELASIGVHR